MQRATCSRRRGWRVLGTGGGCWARRRAEPSLGAEPGLRDLEVALGQLLDVDVLPGHDLDVLDEPGGAVHVPHPGVAHRHLEVDLAALTANLQVHVVGEVEPPLRLDDIGEQPDDVAILPVERQLHLGLVLVEILGAHPASSRTPGSFSPMTRATLTYDRRWTGHGPYLLS